MSNAADPAFLGIGWAFPPTLTAGGAEVEMVSGVEDIEQSLQVILRTTPGERLMQETFGCDLSSLLFEEVDQRLLAQIERLVSSALLDQEPRIVVNSVDTSQSDSEAGLILISIIYTVRATNTRYNMVYPFYLREATLLGS